MGSVRCAAAVARKRLRTLHCEALHTPPGTNARVELMWVELRDSMYKVVGVSKNKKLALSNSRARTDIERMIKRLLAARERDNGGIVNGGVGF